VSMAGLFGRSFEESSLQLPERYGSSPSDLKALKVIRAGKSDPIDAELAAPRGTQPNCDRCPQTDERDRGSDPAAAGRQNQRAEGAPCSDEPPGRAWCGARDDVRCDPAFGQPKSALSAALSTWSSGGIVLPSAVRA
jgi:hypothetical protein